VNVQRATPYKEAWRPTRTRLSAIVDSIRRHVVGTWTAHGDIEFVNRNGRDYLGKNAWHELKSGPTPAVVHPDDLSVWFGPTNRAVLTGKPI